MKKKMKDIGLVIKIWIIAFIGPVATYYSEEYSILMNFSYKIFGYWVPLLSAVLTIVLCILVFKDHIKKVNGGNKK